MLHIKNFNLSNYFSLYNAVAHQLKVIGYTPILGLNDLRKKTALYLREHADNFLPFIDNPESDELLSMEQYEKYCDSIAETSAWGGAIEVTFLMVSLFDMRVQI